VAAVEEEKEGEETEGVRQAGGAERPESGVRMTALPVTFHGESVRRWMEEKEGGV
jgi:hypothetical protein